MIEPSLLDFIIGGVALVLGGGSMYGINRYRNGNGNGNGVIKIKGADLLAVMERNAKTNAKTNLLMQRMSKDIRYIRRAEEERKTRADERAAVEAEMLQRLDRD